MSKKLWVMLILGSCLCFAAGPASAELLLEENFDYAAGTLLTATGNWTAHSGGGTQPIDVQAPGLSYAGYPSSGIGNAAWVDNNGEDDNRTFTMQSTGAVYYGFMLSSSSPTAGYFMHLIQTGTTFAARVFAQPSGGGMNVGVSNSSTAPTYNPTVLALNSTHLIVVKFDFTTGFSYIWLNPPMGGAEPTPDQTSATSVTFSAGAVALRQYSATQNFVVDGIRVGTTWADVVGGGVPNPGACCFADGSCTEVLEADCLASGGVYQGDGTLCTPNPCPQLGTCCISGVCTFVLQADCAGVWTEGGSCEPNPCTVPTGSCCYPDGTCAVTIQADCTATWLLDGVCEPNTCAQPTGSCCYPDGSCAVTLLADCTGNWTMFGVCEPNTCPQPTGACCFDTGLCVTGTEADCLSSGGAYQGNFTTCSPNPCAAPFKTLCEVAEDDANGVAVLVGQRVTVEGTALCDGMTWSTTIREFQITDGNCCIDVFGGDLLPAVALGDLVRVTGTVANYAGKTEISTPDLVVTVLSSGTPPAPGVTTTGNLAAAGEPFESCLFQIHCVTIVGGDPWPASGANANITIDDGSGPVTMRIDKDTDIDGSPAPTGPFTVIGVGDQYDTTVPHTTGYQIKPRMLADLSFDCATGACCFPDGSCTVSNAQGCVAAGGVYSGDGTVCVPNDCPPPAGACCFPSGVCEMLTQEACGANLWLGFGSACMPDNPCEQPTGSCCYPDGSCIVMMQAPCTGIWTMFGVCEPNTCEQPPVYGSCCYPDGSCAVTIEADCTAIWLANGVCEPNTCPQPPEPGACCDHATGDCTITLEANCAYDWLGAGVPCNLETCPPPVPTERTSWGTIKNMYR